MIRKVNVYVCPSGHQTVTVDRDEGVTPFMLGCRQHGCDRMAQSSFYRVDQSLTPTWEWYRPDSDELARAGIDMADHAKQGGLFIRRIGVGKPGGIPTGRQLVRMGGKFSATPTPKGGV